MIITGLDAGAHHGQGNLWAISVIQDVNSVDFFRLSLCGDEEGEGGGMLGCIGLYGSDGLLCMRMKHTVKFCLFGGTCMNAGFWRHIYI